MDLPEGSTILADKGYTDYDYEALHQNSPLFSMGTTCSGWRGAWHTLSWCLMVLPEFREDGWLPEGHYDTSWEEVVDRFGGSSGSRRELVLRGLLDWRDGLRAKGVSGYVVLDGSFVSAKEDPGDFDVLIVMDDHVRNSLENDIEAQRLVDYSWCKKVGFDMLPFFATTISQNPDYLKVWDIDDRTGVQKGVLEVVL